MNTSSLASFLFSLLTLLVGGCTHNASSLSSVQCSPFEVRFGSSLDPRFVEPFKRASATWEGVLGGRVLFHASDVPGQFRYERCVVNVIDVGSDDAGVYEGQGDVSPTDRLEGVVRFRSDELQAHLGDEPYLYALSLHELGHILGLPHDTSMGHESVMWPYVTVPARIGCEDERRACALWGCEATCVGDGFIE